MQKGFKFHTPRLTSTLASSPTLLDGRGNEATGTLLRFVFVKHLESHIIRGCLDQSFSQSFLDLGILIYLCIKHGSEILLQVSRAMSRCKTTPIGHEQEML